MGLFISAIGVFGKRLYNYVVPIAGVDADGVTRIVRVSSTGAVETTATIAAPASVQRTAGGSTVTASGTVAPGAKSVTFICGQSFAGTIAGMTFEATESISYHAPAGDTLGAIAYTITAGSIRIPTVV